MLHWIKEDEKLIKGKEEETRKAHIVVVALVMTVIVLMSPRSGSINRRNT